MGSGQSKPEEATRTTSATQESLPSSSASPLPTTVDSTSQKGPSESSDGGCPMQRADGSYNYDIFAMFRKEFPHGPSGSRPLSKEAEAPVQNDISGGCPVKQAPASSEGGCPVKHQEYNVYSQPIDSKNNMPQVANQLMAPGQTKPLSTHRVPSTIPKVSRRF
jgi:hypothetical protein